MLRWALGRLPIGDEERQRLEREASEARGFVSNLERLLIAVDDSAKGKFASRLAGLLAGSRGMPVTLLRLGEPASDEAKPEAAVRDAAQKSSPGPEKENQAIDVTVRLAAAPRKEAVADAAKRGHDLLVIGLERTVAPEGGFDRDVIEIAQGFPGPLSIVSARGVHVANPLDAELDILVPITGTDASRRGAEVGLALARATGARITALHVEASAGREPLRLRRLQPKQDRAALKREIVRLAEQYGVAIRSEVRINIAPEDAILRQARLGGHNLIVMGVNRRPGDVLSFGHVAGSVIESAERSVMLVSTAAT
jgi:nucleotide-binding universal stress UspA family protein